MVKKVAVLMGGWSNEREISLSSGRQCMQALVQLGFEVLAIDVTQAKLLSDSFIQKLVHWQPDVVFNALHGPFGEDGGVQAILEYLNIPYTHSGVLASALAMDKARAKAVVAAQGVAVAPSLVVNRHAIDTKHLMEPPYVLKPVAEGSSFGIIIVNKGEEVPLDLLHAADWVYGDTLLVERYIGGRDLTCVAMGQQTLDVCEVLPAAAYKFYDFNAKYNDNGSKHICPAEILPNIYQDVQRMTLVAHKAIGCRGITRSDFRFNEATGELCWLEINTQPGMTPTSLVPDIASVSNLSFESLVLWLVEDASCRL